MPASMLRPRLWPMAFLAIVLGTLLFLTLRPYNGNVVALFHIDQQKAIDYALPKGLLVLTVPGYDGEQYYEIARLMPALINHSRWSDVSVHSAISYSYQRFLLPLAAFLIAFGQEPLLPYTFLAIQIISLLGICFLMLRTHPRKPLYALALALCPAALIGLHFSLAEPLTLLLLTAFLVRFESRDTIRSLDLLLLSLLVLAREVNILFVGVLLLYLLWRRRWPEACLLLVPALSFLALHTLIFAVFHEIPFLWSADKHTLPLGAVLPLLIGERGYNVYTLSAIALFLCFVLPAFVWSISSVIKDRATHFLPLATLAFLFVMSVMAPEIWGAITSIGRVITPVYPLVLLHAAEEDTLPARMISAAILALGLASGFGLALMPHPYTFS